MIRGIVLLVLAVGASPLWSQSINAQFEHLSVKDGLSHNSVNCMLQDREGFLWFGTNDGLNKYDGYVFTTFQPDPARPDHSFRNNRIAGMCEGRRRPSSLWVVTEGGGLHEIDKRTGQVTPHPIQTENANRWNNQLSVCEDRDGILWISAYDGIARYDPERHHFQLYRSPAKETPIKSIFIDRQGQFWVGTYHGLYTFDKKNGHFSLVSSPTARGVQPVFNSFHLDKRNTLWVGTAGDGIFQIDLNNRPVRPVPFQPEGQVNPFVYLNALHGDNQGFLWVATTEGLQRIDADGRRIVTYRPDPNSPKGISSTNAQAAYHDRSGRLWVGTNNGIDRLAMPTKPFATFQIKPSAGTANLIENKTNVVLIDNDNRLWLSNQRNVFRASLDHTVSLVPSSALGGVGPHENYTTSMLADTGGVWFGTWNGLYFYDKLTNKFRSYPSEVPTQFISRGPTGTIWIGGEGGIGSFEPVAQQYTYYKYDPDSQKGLPDKFVYAILASRTGDVWVAVNGKGISRLNPKTGHFVHYTPSSQPGKLNSNEVLAFYEDAQGIIWIGTNQGGLNRLDPKTGRFTYFTTQAGLPTNRVVGIISDPSGNLWLSTSKGLCRFDPRTQSVRNYTINDGLPSNDFLENAIARQNNRLYFGNLNGLVHFNPDSIRDDTRPFPVHITGFKVLDRSRPLTGEPITLNHDENFLSFEFVALTYELPEKSQYKYQLTGIDKGWGQNGNRRFVNYTSLPPGHYTFRVKASNSDGIWNEEGTSLQITILPPWWATWWAYGLYIVALIGAVVGGLRTYTNRIRQREELVFNQRKAEQLRAVNDLKSRFFSNITHEFRTPLTLIISPVDSLLQRSALDTETRARLASVQRNAGQLLGLVNQLLDMSKLEADSMPVTLKRGNIADYISQLVEPFGHIAEQKNVRLLYTADVDDREYLFDDDKWNKILANLLSNAVKFTSSGGQVAVSAAFDSVAGTDDPPRVRITVADTGIGIPADRLDHIYDRFYQVDNSRTRPYEGTGIGLALAKELTELMGGTIEVRSELGSGTTFTVHLPVQPVTGEVDVPEVGMPVVAPHIFHPAVASKDEPDVVPEDDKKEKTDTSALPVVLVVEDNQELREFIARELSGSYRVLKAADGEEGWERTKEELPDVVISDLMMPKMDGYALTRHIKSDPATNHIAVVLLTARAAQDSRIEGLQQGADEYLTKPFQPEELRLRIRNLISYQQKLRAKYRMQIENPDVSAPDNTVQHEFIDQLYGLIEANLENPDYGVDQLVESVNLTRRTFSRKLQSLTDVTPAHFVQYYRLQKATELLRSGKSSGETAHLVGFKTHAHFTSAFKKMYHMTPTEYIKKH
ncbi:two-component regulator propeller domain-containing protein [Spirosoma fluminis]